MNNESRIAKIAIEFGSRYGKKASEYIYSLYVNYPMGPLLEILEKIYCKNIRDFDSLKEIVTFRLEEIFNASRRI